MTQLLERSASSDAALNQAVLFINSLGGNPLPFDVDRNTLRVTLENHASKNLQRWLVQVTEQQVLARF